MLRRLGALGGLALVAGSVVCLAPPALAAGPTLNGETFSAGSNLASPLPADQCTENPDGTTSFTIEVSGFASGPVNGTFTERIDVTIGAPTGAPSPAAPYTGPPSELVALHASFTISGFDGTTVTGTKDLAGTAPGDFGGCAEFDATPSFAGLLYGASQEFNASLLTYHASITQGGQTYADEGTSSAGAVEAYVSRYNLFPSPANGGRNAFGIRESFISQPLDRPAVLSITPSEAVNPVGTDHELTAAVQTSSGTAVNGATVRFQISGATTTTRACTTAADGTCSVSDTGPVLPGADLISAFVDTNGDGTAQAGEPTDEATKSWVAPASTTGHTTGGGQLPGDINPIAFGFTAKNTSLPQGECNVIDRDADVHLKCTTVTTLVQTGTHVTFFGSGVIDGVPMTYRIDVDDTGEPGTADTFTITTSTGYSTGGVLLHGNVQVK